MLSACSGGGELDAGTVLADVQDVPEGAAIPVVVNDVPIIVSHTPDGQLRAFSAICTHQGCKVLPPAAEEPEVLVCPCHYSEFSTFSGEVLKGPASEDLPELAITVREGKIIAD